MTSEAAISGDSAGAPAAGYSILLWLTSLLFALRVFGQATQYWFPLPSLPPFDSFQGSSLNYPLLLSAQLMILCLMLRISWRAWQAKLIASHRVGLILLSIGSIYMLGSVLRIAVGLTISNAAPWFSTWIPAIFHVVLAIFVLTLAAFHLRYSRVTAVEKL